MSYDGWVAVCRDRWFFLAGDPSAFELRVDDPASEPVGTFRSLTAAASKALDMAGRRGRMSGPRFWGTESQEWCPGCGMGSGAFHTSLTYQGVVDSMRGREYRGAPGHMIPRAERNVRKEMAKQRRLLWEEHCGACEAGWSDQ